MTTQLELSATDPDLEDGQVKCCSRCKEEKILSKFRRDSTKKYGVRAHCLKCESITTREWRIKNCATEKYKARRRASEKRYRQKFPEKAKAHNVARKWKTNDRCEICGGHNPNLHRHHPDYTKPDTFVTVCQPCHVVLHHGDKKS